MNVLVCAAPGRRLSEPPRPLPPELPERPACHGTANADGSRHALSAGPRDTRAVRVVPA
ncbi:hypothetical protein GCM10010521_39700 [Streptomyces rameus]|uniref:Uncharacterized protein n=1 Tax=Streptomyces rameus TaxID=68261 RepID=A0ABP6NHK3_9ACTN